MNIFFGIDKSESHQPNITEHFIQSQSQLNPISNEILEQTRKSFRGKDMINGIVSRIEKFKQTKSLLLPKEFN
jgi:hypothetical protein